MGKHSTAETEIIAFADLTLDYNCGNVLLITGGCCLHRAIDKGNICKYNFYTKSAIDFFSPDVAILVGGV